MRKSLPTIQDVAREAKVSTATVSRALSMPGRVSQQTRQMVIEAVERTGYAVNHTARNLRRKETGSIVVLVPNLGNPFFSQILAGIEARLADAGYNVLVADTKHPAAKEERLLDYLHANRADGIITLDGSLPAHLFAVDERRIPPVVTCCEWMGGADFPSIRFDNFGGESLAVRHLATRGHTAIGHVLGPPANVLTIERLAGFEAALQALDLERRADWLFDGDFSLASGVAAAQRWIAMTDRPTAMTTSSDVMACGFISELHRNGYEVPRDVSVIGFDDIEIAEIFIPALTTIRQPRSEIGNSAAEALLAIVKAESGEGAAGVVRLWPAQLVERESVRTL